MKKLFGYLSTAALVLSPIGFAHAKAICVNLRQTGYEVVTLLGPGSYEIVHPYNRYLQDPVGRAVLQTKGSDRIKQPGPLGGDLWVKVDLVNWNDNPHTTMPTKNGFGMKVVVLKEAEPAECANQQPAVKKKTNEQVLQEKLDKCIERKGEKWCKGCFESAQKRGINPDCRLGKPGKNGEYVGR